jgi:methionine synthase II (cobalamin-independent)
MRDLFQANGMATMIGSLPLTDHSKAIDLILEHTPDIPFWAQLTTHPEEGMMIQFTHGLPGICRDTGGIFVNTSSATFDADLLQFYEEYMSVTGGEIDPEASRFILTKDAARGFFLLLERLANLPAVPMAVKGQITGPFTLGTGIVDQNKRAIFYDVQLRDAVVKLLAMKARWQVRRLSRYVQPVLIFIDEPGLAGFGSSGFTSISRDDVNQCLEEICEAVHGAGGLAGIHVCANTDWALLLESSADIISFDAYGYFDRFILYPVQIKKFLESERILAWGIVPTLNAQQVERETSDSLLAQWREKADQLASLGISMQKLISQSLITPSCGVGSLDLESAEKVVKLTQSVSRQIRSLSFDRDCAR